MRLNLKHESFTSLSNVGSMDERQIRSKTNISYREMGFRNSFHEWSAYQVQGSPGLKMNSYVFTLAPS